MKNNTKIFNKPYTVSRNGKTYPLVRPWIRPWAEYVRDQIKKDKASKQPVSYSTLDSPTGSAKLLAMITLGEYIAGHHSQLIIAHSDSLRQQHKEDVADLIRQSWTTKNVLVETFAMLASVIKKDNDNKTLSEKDEILISHLKNTEIVFLDELHKYSKGDIKCLPLILAYLTNHNLKVAIGVTATSKHCEGWYKFISNQMNINLQQAYYDRKYVYRKVDAANDGVITIPEIVAVHSSLKLDIEHGEFSYPLAELLDKDYKWLEKNGNNILKKSLIDIDPKALKNKVKNNEVSMSRLYEHLRTFVKNRMKQAIYILHQPQQHGKPALVYVPLQNDANEFEKLFNKTRSKLSSKYECLAWHGSSHEYHTNNSDSQKIQKRLQDPADPLKTVVLVGMWKEAADIQKLMQVHDCGFNPKNIDRTDQIRGRLRNGGQYFIYIDAVNAKELAEKQQEEMKQVFGEDHDEKWLAAVLAAAEVVKEDDDDSNQYGESKNIDDYVDGDLLKDVNESLEDVFGISENPTVVGWIKKVHKGKSTALVIPSKVFLDRNNKIHLSKPMKLENLFKGFARAA